MADIQGTNLSAGIAPFTTEDTYPTHYSEYGKGGWHEVNTIADRDNIPEARRANGMAVSVVENNKVYIYSKPNWIEFTGGTVGDLSNYYNKSEVDNKINENQPSWISMGDILNG